MKITSVFDPGKEIHAKYTCDGANTVTPVTVSDVPAQAKSLVLIRDDPDIPEFVKLKYKISVFDHWVLFNIPATTKIIDGKKGVHGKNGAGKNEYTGPCPPDKQHRYFYKIFALDSLLPLQEGATKDEVITAMNGHIICEAELVGRYARNH